MAKTVLIEMDDLLATKVQWIAEKLGCSLSELFISLIPTLPEKVAETVTKVVSENEVSQAEVTNLVLVCDFDRDKVRVLVDKLINHEKGWGSTLGKEIRKQLLDTDSQHLTVGTYKRLSRWISPYRTAKREEFVSEIAKAISMELFGQHIERINT